MLYEQTHTHTHTNTHSQVCLCAGVEWHRLKPHLFGLLYTNFNTQKHGWGSISFVNIPARLDNQYGKYGSRFSKQTYQSYAYILMCPRVHLYALSCSRYIQDHAGKQRNGYAIIHERHKNCTLVNHVMIQCNTWGLNSTNEYEYPSHPLVSGSLFHLRNVHCLQTVLS